MSFVNRMDLNVVKYRYPNKNMVVVQICLNGRCCYSKCVGIVSDIQGKDDDSLPLLAFRRHVVNVIFLKYSKEG